ncbi:hypothetical protein PPYR_00215 [Photinus pyralis]|uniref:DUF4218 domain-containing protein n=1 Tax=Photinus pyralis TaxID=7054 RepID=A0A1Y1NIN1_PHOPY|nr:hypothetical protein PPYR_05400 [Photinus pyralis]KAB0803245.1 hypothetical protein PPYR_00215 [Photinus pyralis]
MPKYKLSRTHYRHAQQLSNDTIELINRTVIETVPTSVATSNETTESAQSTPIIGDDTVSEYESESDSIDDLDVDDEFRSTTPSRDENPVNSTEGLNPSNYSSQTTFASLLADWGVTYHIEHIALNSLLRLLRQHFDNNLPADARTLLKTPRRTDLQEIFPGKFFYFGLDSAVNKILDKYELSDNIDVIKIGVNVDGLPLSKSSGSQLYPIICNLWENPSVVEMIGLYHGYEKPSDPNIFMQDFINDAVLFTNNGFMYKNRTIPFRVNAIICDVPAKSFITFTKGHSGYNSCSKCHIEGEYVNNRVCFYNSSNVRSRCDTDFRQKLDEEHHTGTSILEILPNFDMIRNIPLDYMHLICLGVMRKLLLLWVFGKPNSKLAHIQVSRISNYLVELSKNIPCEFVRKPRSLDDLKRFKATEFRQILMYTGPLVFKTTLSKDRYANFLSLHVAMRIFSNESHLAEHGDYAHDLLKYFIDTFVILYGKENVSHNVHNLLHLREDCKNFGVLQNFSGFPFENYLQSLKLLIRKGSDPLPQIIKRIIEKDCRHTDAKKYHQVSTTTPKPNKLHNNGPLLNHNRTRNILYQYKELCFEKFTVKLTESDSCCGLTDGNIICIKNIVTNADNELYVIAQKFNLKTNLYFQPLPSSALNIYIVNDLGPLEVWSVDEITCKYVKMRYNDRFVVVPLLHC